MMKYLITLGSCFRRNTEFSTNRAGLSTRPI